MTSERLLRGDNVSITQNEPKKTGCFKNFLTLQKQFMREHNAFIIIVSILFFLYYVGILSTGCMFIKADVDYEIDTFTKFEEYLFKWNTITILGCVVLAAMSAVFSFNWMNNRQKIDFFEALPVKRNIRWFANYLSGMLMVVIPAALFCLLGLVCTGFFGYFYNHLIIHVVCNFIKEISFFAAIYSITVFSMMLCGNSFIALLLCTVLNLVEGDILLLSNFYPSACFETYYLNFYNTFEECNFISPFLKVFLHNDMKNSLVLYDIVFAIVMTVISFVIFHFRKNEMAGNSFVFNKVKMFTFVSVTILGTLNVMLMFIYLFKDSNRIKTNVFLVLVTVVICFIISMIMNLILLNGVKALFKNFKFTLACCVFASVFIISFRLDLFGYNSYLPNPSKVESCALFDAYYGSDNELFNSEYASDSQRISKYFAEKYMNITDVQSFERIAAVGQRNKVTNEIYGNDLVVLYRMKNGRKIYRVITVPFNIDEALMDKVTSSNQFKEGAFKIYHVDEFEKEYPENHDFSYHSYGESIHSTKRSAVKEFVKAYKKDLESYSYSKEKNDLIIGKVQYSGEKDYCKRSITLPVYASYTNSINVLKQNGMLLSQKASTYNVKAITISHYSNVDGEDIKDKTVTYTDENKMHEILSHVHGNSSNYWMSDEEDDSSEDYYRINMYYMSRKELTDKLIKEKNKNEKDKNEKDNELNSSGSNKEDQDSYDEYDSEYGDEYDDEYGYDDGRDSDEENVIIPVQDEEGRTISNYRNFSFNKNEVPAFVISDLK